MIQLSKSKFVLCHSLIIIRTLHAHVVDILGILMRLIIVLFTNNRNTYVDEKLLSDFQ